MLKEYLLYLVVTVVMCMGCHSVTNRGETGSLRNFPSEVKVGDIVHVATGEKISFPQLVDAVEGARIIYVGEIHSNRESHELQLQLLKEFNKRYGGNIAVGMEMFKRPYQDVLDKWTRGEISEKELLSLTNWQSEWGYDYSLYKDILDFTRDNMIPVVALNISKELQKKVRKKGIKGLSREERGELPEIDTTDFYHRRYLEKIFNRHAELCDEGENFYEVQCVWEESMANSITRYLSSPEGKERRLLVFTGGGHIIYHFGVPKRVYRRNHLAYYTIYPYELREVNPWDEHPLFAKDIPLQPVDYVRVIQVPKGEKRVAFGVVIRHIQYEKEKNKKKVTIERVQKESPAGRAKLQPGDIIQSMDGESISRVYEVIYHVSQKKFGDSCNLEILRKGRKIPVKVTFLY